MASTSISSETETVNGRSSVASLYRVMHQGRTFRYRRRQSRHKSEGQSWRVPAYARQPPSSPADHLAGHSDGVPEHYRKLVRRIPAEHSDLRRKRAFSARRMTSTIGRILGTKWAQNLGAHATY